MKERLKELIDRNREEIIRIGRDLFEHPELGFKEHRTAEKVKAYLEELGYTVVGGLSVTGMKCTAGRGDGVNIGIIAELDAISSPGHRCASKDRDAAHACAHSNQVAIMLGVMKAIKESGMLEATDASVTFIGTPAEEFTDFEYRTELVRKGEIIYMSGKQDMIAKGTFDGIDLLLSCHTMGGELGRKADVNSTLTGFLRKKVTYIGKAAHAGAAPHLGINALNAASIGLMALNAQRETFCEEDMVRVHGIITEGGQTVNSVPERVELEAYVRAVNYAAIQEAASKVDRAFEAGAYAVGAKCTIKDTPGYMPFTQCRDLSQVMKDNLAALIGAENVKDGQKSFASGDIGDVATLIPTIQFGFSGFTGNVHGADFEVVDEEMAYIIPAKAVAMTLWDLVREEGREAKRIMRDNPPRFTKEAYLREWLKEGE